MSLLYFVKISKEEFKTQFLGNGFITLKLVRLLDIFLCSFAHLTMLYPAVKRTNGVAI